MSDTVLRADNLTKSYTVPGGTVRAVRGISLGLQRGTTLAVVGESGCGKSTLARMLVGLEKPDTGEVCRDTLVPMVFQDSLGSLHPRRTVRHLIVEPLLIRDRKIRMTDFYESSAKKLAHSVGLPEEYLGSYPHELSGGQRQRVNIARALSLEPSVLLLDEPVSALDVSIQAQILNLLVELQGSTSLSMVFISHDLSVVRHLAHQVQVLYLGQVVEEGSVERVLGMPLHPYTQALMASDPALSTGAITQTVRGEPPSPYRIQDGCSFAGRCPRVEPQCRVNEPTLLSVGDRSVACFPVAREYGKSHANTKT